MTWVDLSSAFGYGTKLTSTQIQNLRDNIAAMCAGDAGAPEVTKDAMKSTANTTGSSGSVAAGGATSVIMQDWTFFPNGYSQDRSYLQISGCGASTADTVSRLSFGNDHPSIAYNYACRWRYLTASDKPFVQVIRNITTGLIKNLWACDDPPPGFWSLSEKPLNWISPVLFNDDTDDTHDQIMIKLNFEEIVLFNYPKESIDEIGEKAGVDKKLPFEVMNDDYDYDSDKRLFVRKNIGQL